MPRAAIAGLGHRTKLLEKKRAASAHGAPAEGKLVIMKKTIVRFSAWMSENEVQ